MSLTFSEWEEIRRSLSPEDLRVWMLNPVNRAELTAMLDRLSKPGSSEHEQASIASKRDMREWCDRHPDPGYEVGTIFSRTRRGVDKIHTITEVNREDGVRTYAVLVDGMLIHPHPEFVELPPSVLVAQRPSNEEVTSEASDPE